MAYKNLNNLRTIPIETLNYLLRYDPQTGLLFWKRRPVQPRLNMTGVLTWNTRFADKQAFTAITHGYSTGTILGTTFRAHRVCWALHYGEWPTLEVDHINGNRTDNRIENLRLVTRRENCLNTKKVGNLEREFGVYQDKKSGKWYAQAKINGKNKHLGTFHSREAAIARRKEVQKELGYHPNHGLAL